MNLTQNQTDIFYDRYARRSPSGGRIEHDVEQMWRRVADAIGQTEDEKRDFYGILNDFKFVPGGRILSGAGAESGKTFYNCYVIPVETSARRWNRKPANVIYYQTPDTYGEVRDPSWREDHGNDSREAIFDTIGTMVGIMSRGGGVGINWSVLRPKGTYLARVSGTTSGPVSWMDVASRAVGVVEQGGTRRGAAMFMLDDWHPDVIEFINAKRDNQLITNANVSVAVSNAFMEAVKDDADWELRYPDTGHPSYDERWDGDLDAWTAAGLPVVVHKTIRARDLLDAMADSAWASGEPGVVFLGRYNDSSTGQRVERIICVNPCGEQGLGAYSVCNLGAMNLDAYVLNGTFLWGLFYEDVRTAINFLDNVIDADSYFVEETREQQQKLRRTGLGVMGLADALVRMGLRYGSPESVSFTSNVFATMKRAAIEESNRLAYLRGPAKGWDDSMWDRPYLKSHIDSFGKLQYHEFGMRNLFLLTQAPTGTTSLLAGVNSGIEPYFNLKTYRKDRTGDRWVYAKAVADVGESEITVTSKDVTVEEHIAIQAAVQKFVDSSVSKTINAPNEQTVEETKKAFMLAWGSGLKGLAYYRDGSRNIQVLYHEDPNKRIAELEEKVTLLEAKLNSPFRANFGAGYGLTETWKKVCPDCGGEIVHEEGCMKCHSCGWSAC